MMIFLVKFYSPDVSMSWPFHEAHCVAHCVVPEDWRGRFAHFRWAAQRDPRDVFGVLELVGSYAKSNLYYSTYIYI